MPTSSDQGKAEAVEALKPILPFVWSILDVGPGAGGWFDILSPLTDAKWYGLEIWEPYVAEYDLTSKYGHVYIGNAATYDVSQLPRCDLAIFGDVLEHMPKEEGMETVDRLPWKYAVISLPMAGGEFEHQGEECGNPHEEHKASWTEVQAVLAFDPVWSWVSRDIGVFLLERQ